ncbi:MAG: hypothetical protein U9N87_07195, partial [Planctomycetota bacterium]|nr:hypothetical protein [Planctomycetota bacterium]
MGMGMEGGMGPGFGRANQLPKKVDFKSECLVLDLRGGQRLPGKTRLNGPGEILLLDPDGNLVVRNDVTDFDKIRDQTYPPTPKSGFRGPRGGMMDGMEGMMGPGMEGGMGGPGMGMPGMGGP